MVMVDEIDVIHVRFVEDKIKFTMCRLNNLQKWKPKFRYYTLRNWMLAKLRHQLDFLSRVNKVKHVDIKNDM